MESLKGTWKIDTSYISIGDSLSSIIPDFQSVLSFEEDTLENWQFLQFSDSDSARKMLFPSGTTYNEKINLKNCFMCRRKKQI